MIKNENGKVLLPISFIVPRKNQDVFQADLYPPIPGVDAALVRAVVVSVTSIKGSSELMWYGGGWPTCVFLRMRILNASCQDLFS